ncbi:MAG: prepilin-type N-terminal cleavage/methylation domain-containing protein [Acidobacteria bacterium]|nr:prepilin-type N-terminal cleavage/methylation domain-containing protein [Acidobacteriota bacterium]
MNICQSPSHDPAAGFSLLELIIAMALTLVIAAAATTLLAQTLGIRTRENFRAEAIADAQRGLNLMTREIANAGVGLTSNGLVAFDSDSSSEGADSIHIRANLDAFSGDLQTDDENEDVFFQLQTPVDDFGVSHRLLARHDNSSAVTNTDTVLANRLDAFNVQFFDRQTDYTTRRDECDAVSTTVGATEINPAVDGAQNVRYVVLSLCVIHPAVGTPGSPGHQPASQTQLVSDVVLRNSELRHY